MSELKDSSCGNYSSLTISEWTEAYKKNVQQSIAVKFPVFMCSIDTCALRQKELLYNIVFLDPKSVEYWHCYIIYVMETFPLSYLKIPRLIDLAIQLTDEKENYFKFKFVELNLLSVSREKSTEKIIQKFETMHDKGIGINLAVFYEKWSESYEKNGDVEKALIVLQKGIKNHAEPVNTILAKYQQLGPRGDVFITDSLREGSVALAKLDGDGRAPEVLNRSDDKNILITKTRPLNGSQDNKAECAIIKSSRKLTSLGKCQRVIKSPDEKTNDKVSIELQQNLSSSKNAMIKSDETIEFKVDASRQVQTAMCMDDTEDSDTVKQPLSINSAVFNKSSLCAIEDQVVVFKRPLDSLPEDVEHNNSSLEGEEEDTSEMALSSLMESNTDVVSSSSSTSGTTACITIQAETMTAAPRKRVSFANQSDIQSAMAGASGDNARAKSAPQNVQSGEDKGQEVEFKRPSKRSKPDTKVFGSSVKSICASSFLADRAVHVINNQSYLEIGVLGRGGSACVRKILSNEGSIYAFKKIQVNSGNSSLCASMDEEAEEVLESYINEINLLKQFKNNPFIIELIDCEINQSEMSVSMIMEAGEIDLASCISQQKKMTQQSLCVDPKGKQKPFYGSVNPFFARIVWEKMLLAVDHIHSQRIVHGDLKPANFVFVKGQLKLIDFGIAKAISSDTTNIYRDSLIGTINYMSPESLTQSPDSKIKHGRPSDIWSLGCILYQMIFGKPPYATISNFHHRIASISNPATKVEYPDLDDLHALATMKMCLCKNVVERASISGESGLLEHSYLKVSLQSAVNLDNKPLACDSMTDCEENVSTSSEKIKAVVQLALQESFELFKSGGGLTPTSINSISSKAYKMVAGGKDNKSFPVWHDKENAEIDLPKSIHKTITKSQPQKSDPLPLRNALRVKPITSMPHSLQQQIQKQNIIAQPGNVAGLKDRSKWVRPKGSTPEKSDMKSALERKFSDMRKFLNPDDVEDSTINSFDVGDDTFSFI